MFLQEILQQEHKKLHPNEYQLPREDHIDIELLTAALLAKNRNVQESDLYQVDDIVTPEKEFLDIMGFKENISFVDSIPFNTLQDSTEMPSFGYSATTFPHQQPTINPQTINQFSGIAEEVLSSDPNLAKFTKFIPSPKTTRILSETSIAFFQLARTVAKGVDGKLELKDFGNTYQVLNLLKNVAVSTGGKIEKGITLTKTEENEEEDNDSEETLGSILSINPDDRENISIPLPLIQLAEITREEEALENFIEEEEENDAAADEDIIQEADTDFNITAHIKKAAEKTSILFQAAIVGQRLYKISKAAYSMLTSETTKNIAKFLGSTALTILNLVSENSTVIASTLSATLGGVLAPITGGLSLGLVPVAIPVTIGVIKLGVKLVKFAHQYRDPIKEVGSTVVTTSKNVAENIRDEATGHISKLKAKFLESSVGQALLATGSFVNKTVRHFSQKLGISKSQHSEADRIETGEDNLDSGGSSFPSLSGGTSTPSVPGREQHQSESEDDHGHSGDVTDLQDLFQGEVLYQTPIDSQST